MINKEIAFRFRAFTAFWLTFSFLLSVLSGLILFLRPEGSLAAWTGWSALGLNKKQWEGVHTVFVFVLVISASIHLLYNWRTLTAYCRLKKKQFGMVFKGMAVFREFFAAALLTVLILIGTISEWLPCQWIIGWRGIFKSGSAVVTLAPPVADAGKLSLASLCALSGISEQRVLRNAGANGLQLRALSETLSEIAKKNGMSPEKIYGLLFMK
ncbi:MAG TPA: DUF4405 domain-containing protein [Patescibacteria group bacterium]|nr:DUF4405 domain-containing protein [Patescibacteria group bacterium]